MTCQDCEVFLAEGEMADAIEEHVRTCAECRALREDLRANALALESLKSAELPAIRVKIPRRRHVYPWVAAAAAAGFALAALFVPRTSQVKPAAYPAGYPDVEEPGQPQQARETAKVEPVRLRPQKVQPLKIKILTPDPDVVIYWLIDN